MEPTPDGLIRFDIRGGEKKFVREGLVRATLPKPKWWEWRYKRERAELVAIAAHYGVTIHEE